MAALVSYVGCDVYDQALIDGALGDDGGSGVGATAGTPMGGGTGGSFGGSGGISSGGSSGTLPVGGTESSGGSPGGGGSNGTGGEGDSSSGGTSGGGKGGSSTGGEGGTGEGGTSGGSGTAGRGGNAGSGGAGNGGDGVAGGGASGAGTSGGGAGTGGVASGGAGTGGGGMAGGGAGGTAGSGGSGGMGEVCSGCARLSVPLGASGDKAHFTITLPAATDFSAATIAFRVARYSATGGWFKGYIQEGSPNYLYQDSVETTLASIGTSLQTITWDVATAGTTADKTIIRRIGIEISGAGASSWTTPTVVYVDSVTITGTNLAMATFTFDTAATVSTTPTSNGPNNVLWLNNSSSDTNVTGAALSWLGP